MLLIQLYFGTSFYTSGTVLNNGDMEMNKSPCPQGASKTEQHATLFAPIRWKNDRKVHWPFPVTDTQGLYYKLKTELLRAPRLNIHKLKSAHDCYLLKNLYQYFIIYSFSKIYF